MPFHVGTVGGREGGAPAPVFVPLPVFQPPTFRPSAPIPPQRFTEGRAPFTGTTEEQFRQIALLPIPPQPAPAFLSQFTDPIRGLALPPLPGPVQTGVFRPLTPATLPIPPTTAAERQIPFTVPVGLTIGERIASAARTAASAAGTVLSTAGAVIGSPAAGQITQTTLNILCGLGLLPGCRPPTFQQALPQPGDPGVSFFQTINQGGGAMPLVEGSFTGSGPGFDLGDLFGSNSVFRNLFGTQVAPAAIGAPPPLLLGPGGTSVPTTQLGPLGPVAAGGGACITPRLTASMRLPRIVDVPMTDSAGNLKCARYIKAPTPRYRVTMTNPTRGRRGRR
jgi:hypothetical protein